MGQDSKTTQKIEMNAPSWSKDFTNKSNEMGVQGIDNANKAANSWFNPQAGSWQQNVIDQASGKHLKEENPYYQQRLQNQIDASNDDVQRMFAGAGRMGSAANTTALAQNSSNMRLSGLEQDYNRAFNSMLGSQQFLNQAQNQAIGNQINPIQNLINRLTGQTTTQIKEGNFWNDFLGLAGGVGGALFGDKNNR